MASRTTRSVIEESRKQFDRILIDTLGLEEDSPIILALKEEFILTFNDLHTLTAQDIDTLSYTTDVEVDKELTIVSNKLSKGHRGWIKALLAFMRYYDIDSYEEINNISMHDFDKFRMGIYIPSNNPTKITSNSTTNNRYKATSGAEAFRKSIKKDRSTYPTFREDRQWDKWNRSIKALARTHDCEEIFDPTYKPNGDDEEETFTEKQKFIYSVFEDKVLTNTGQALVCKFEKTFDAQKRI